VSLLSGRAPLLFGKRRKDEGSVGQKRGSALLECVLKEKVVEERREAVAVRVDWKSLELLIQTRKVLCPEGLRISGDRYGLQKKETTPEPTSMSRLTEVFAVGDVDDEVVEEGVSCCPIAFFS